MRKKEKARTRNENSSLAGPRGQTRSSFLSASIFMPSVSFFTSLPAIFSVFISFSYFMFTRSIPLFCPFSFCYPLISRFILIVLIPNFLIFYFFQFSFSPGCFFLRYFLLTFSPGSFSFHLCLLLISFFKFSIPLSIPFLSPFVRLPLIFIFVLIALVFVIFYFIVHYFFVSFPIFFFNFLFFS